MADAAVNITTTLCAIEMMIDRPSERGASPATNARLVSAITIAQNSIVRAADA